MAEDIRDIAYRLGGKVQKHAKSTQIAAPGDTIDNAYVVLSGRVRQYDIRSNGTDITLNVYREGSLLTLPWILDKNVSTNFVECIEDSQLIAVPIQELSKEFASNHELTFEMLKRLSRGIDGIFTRLAAHGTNDASYKIMTELKIEAARFGEDTQKGTLVVIRPSVIANRTGMARETVSRNLRKLIESKTLLEHSSGYIIPK